MVIDTPQLPTKAVAMRDMVEAIGPIQYLINTEHHVDHIFGNYWFKGRTTIVHHQGVHERFMTVYPELDPFEYALEALPDGRPRTAPPWSRTARPTTRTWAPRTSCSPAT